MQWLTRIHQMNMQDVCMMPHDSTVPCMVVRLTESVWFTSLSIAGILTASFRILEKRGPTTASYIHVAPCCNSGIEVMHEASTAFNKSQAMVLTAPLSVAILAKSAQLLSLHRTEGSCSLLEVLPLSLRSNHSCSMQRTITIAAQATQTFRSLEVTSTAASIPTTATQENSMLDLSKAACSGEVVRWPVPVCHPRCLMTRLP